MIANGTQAASADPVVTPTNLVPGLPGTLSVGDWLFCFTACTSLTATVATPAGWQSTGNVVGANGRVVCFAKKVAGGETAPTVAWSGLTTGLAGTPCSARIFNMGTGFNEVAGTLQIEVLGAVSDQAASTTTMAGGAAVTTTNPGAICFAMGVRQNEALTAIGDAGTGLAWTAVMADTNVSGAGIMHAMSWGIKTAPGVIGAHTWAVTSTASVASSGVILSLQAALDPVPTVTLTKSRLQLRQL